MLTEEPALSAATKNLRAVVAGQRPNGQIPAGGGQALQRRVNFGRLKRPQNDIAARRPDKSPKPNTGP